MNSRPNNIRPVLVLAPGVLAGAEKVVLTGLVGLRDMGLNPLMIIIRETRAPHFAETFLKAMPADVESITIDSTKAFDLQLPKRLKAALLLNQSSPIILHSHGFKALIACYMMKGKLPHLHTHHGNTAHTLKVRIYEKIAMITMKTCDHVIAVSHKMKQELDQKLHPYNKITVIENMLSLTNAAKIRSERALRNQNKNVIELLYVGRLSPEKGLLPFLESLATSTVKERFHLTVLGDGVERKLVENFIIDHKMQTQVTLHGFVSDPSSFFITPDILIMPSLREGLPMTLIEALASGVPVLANNVGAIASMVTHNTNGYFAKDFSTESWNEALLKTSENYQMWMKNAASDAESVEERFSLKKWTQKTRELYDLAIKS
jgi:glycosyltransferase involved in cell wall biosynthesis